MLFDAGVPAPEVQQAMGHSSLQVTELYSRPRDGAAGRSTARLNDFLRGPSVGQAEFPSKPGSEPKGKTPGGPGVFRRWLRRASIP